MLWQKIYLVRVSTETCYGCGNSQRKTVMATTMQELYIQGFVNSFKKRVSSGTRSRWVWSINTDITIGMYYE